MVPPLPYRPLEVRGHGVCDPHTGRFYPFVVHTHSTPVPAKPGIRFFLHRVTLSVSKWGDSGAGFAYVSGTIGGVNYNLIGINGPVTTAAGNQVFGATVSDTLDMLLDPGTGIGASVAAFSSYVYMIEFAEIPADEGEIA